MQSYSKLMLLRVVCTGTQTKGQNEKQCDQYAELLRIHLTFGGGVFGKG
jgi:hypothetical protein